MAIELRGYSERGMVNALCDDIRRRSDLSDETRATRRARCRRSSAAIATSP